MSYSKNHVSLIGVVARDAELKSTESGLKYVRLSLATDTGGYTKRDGKEVKKQTMWHDIVAWNNLAEYAGNHVKKGMRIAVDGMLLYREYKSADGVMVKRTEISASDIIVFGKPKKNELQESSEVVEPLTVTEEKSEENLPF